VVTAKIISTVIILWVVVDHSISTVGFIPSKSLKLH